MIASIKAVSPYGRCLILTGARSFMRRPKFLHQSAFIATLLLLFCASFETANAEVPVHKCDDLAASPGDPNGVASGRSFDALDVSAAIAACEEANKQYPGTARFQYQLGRAYHKAKNFELAVKWYRIAGEKGHSSAQYNLGWMYDQGDGVRKDAIEAVKWYRLAAEQGGDDAQYNLGWMYDQGKGVGQNPAEAAKWYRRAAQQGNASAQATLGVMLASRAVDQENLDEAFGWLQKAAKQDEVYAQDKYFEVLFTDNANYGTFDPKEARKIIKKAAENQTETQMLDDRQPAAQYRYYAFLDRGYGGDKDSIEAIKWLRKSANNGYKIAKFELAHRLWKGRGVQQDELEAAKLFNQLTSYGYPVPKFYEYNVSNQNEQQETSKSCAELWLQYPTMAQPPIKDSHIPVQLRFNMQLMDLKSVDTKDQSVTATARVNYKFDDTRYLYDPVSFNGTTCRVPAKVLWESQPKTLPASWDPGIIALNSPENRFLTSPIVTIRPDGMLEYNTELQGRFEANLDLHDFPFDIQHIALKFGSRQNSLSMIELVDAADDRSKSAQYNSATNQEWIKLSENVEFSYETRGSQNFSVAVLDAKLKRNPNYYILKIVIPLFLLFLVSTSQFWLKWDALASRVSIASTSLVAVIAYQFVIQGDLPKLPYMTALDKIIFLTFFLIVLGIAELVVVFTLTRMVERQRSRISVFSSVAGSTFRPKLLAEKIDFHSRYGYPLLWIVSASIIAFQPVWHWTYAS
jgi:TPR repeat protein